MQLGRIEHDGVIHLARLEGNEFVSVAQESSRPGADVLREALVGGVDLAGDGARVDADAVRVLAPVANPSKVLAIGLNYADHARETGTTPPETPMIFVKTNNSIAGPGDPIVWWDADSTQVDYEAELAVVIGRRATRIDHDPFSYVLGYTCCNDVSARDAQFADQQWVRGKSFDTFCPLGPLVVTADEIPDPQTLAISCDVNGERLQDSSTAEMIFGVADLVAYCSHFITLEPGDVIATGTPFGVGFARTPPRYLQDGDVVTVAVEGVGELTNPCVVR